MLNAGKYNKRIAIYEVVKVVDDDGFNADQERLVLSCWANVKTTKGFTLIANNSDFEKATTNFTIRYSKKVEDAYYNSNVSNRSMTIKYRKKVYTVQYLNNVNEDNTEIEIKADTIVAALGSRKNVMDVTGITKPVHYVGDCSGERTADIASAIRTAYHTANAI